jgi:hypothetical protein
MSPIEIEARLDERFRLLVGGRRSRMERHQTMRGTVDWSYELCSEVERRVFCSLSVFAGEFDLDGALGVAAGDDIDRWDSEDALARLVDRSLVQRLAAPDGTTRYRLLETMRAYGHERLVESGTADAARLRHVEYTADTVRALGLRALGPDEDEVRNQIRRMTADLLQATDWCLEQHEWRFLPQLCSYPVSWSSPGVAFPLWDRVSSVIPQLDEPMEGVAPLVHLGLLAHSSTIGTAEVRSSERQAFVDLVEAGESLPQDGIYVAPILDGYRDDDVPDGIVPAIARYLDGLRAAPPAVRWSQTFMAHYCLCGIDVGAAVRLYPAFEEVTGQLASPSALRHFSSQGALMFELQGDLVRADEHARRSLIPNPFSWSDVLNACRAARISAKAHGRLSGADLRRPIDWEFEIAGGHMQDVPLASVAVALDAAGHTVLAHRVIATMAPATRLDYSKVFRGNASEALLEVFRTPSLPEEDLDAVIVEIRALAEEFDRLEKSA